MKSCIEARDYLKNTSPNEIAMRTAIFGAYFNNFLGKNFGHDYILDLVAALYGKFDFNVKNDEKIMSLLDAINYGNDQLWPQKFKLWVWQNFEGNAEEQTAFQEAWEILNETSKGEEILGAFMHIVQEIRPDAYQYFPELSMTGYARDDIWPRI